MLRQAAQRRALPGEINYPAADRYTVAHFAWGVLMGAARLPWWAALGIAVGWEIVERPLKDRFGHRFPYATQDTLANATVDALAMMSGYAAWRALPPLPPTSPIAGK